MSVFPAYPVLSVDGTPPFQFLFSIARAMADVRLDTLPQDLSCSTIGSRLIRKACGTAGSVNIVLRVRVPCSVKPNQQA